jgi:hypothetical protein
MENMLCGEHYFRELSWNELRILFRALTVASNFHRTVTVDKDESFCHVVI